MSRDSLALGKRSGSLGQTFTVFKGSSDEALVTSATPHHTTESWSAMCTLVLEAGKVTISAAMGFPSRSIPIPTGKPSCMLWEKDWSLEESHALYLKGSSDEAPVRYASSPLPNRDRDCASVLGEEIKRCWCEEGADVPSQSVLQKACPSSHNTLRSHKNTLKQMFP